MFKPKRQLLFDAIRDGNHRRVKELCHQFGQLLNQPEPSTEMLPIQLAAYEGQLDVVKVLLKAGANPTQGNRPVRMQSHALYYAETRGFDDIVKCIRQYLAVFRRHTIEGQDLCDAIRNGDIDLVEELLKKDSSLANATEFGDASGFEGGDPVLHYAIQKGSPESVELLIQYGANLKSRCRRGRNPIQTALGFMVGFGHRPGLDKELELGKRVKIADILLDAGIKPDLWVECCMGNLPGVQAIVEADPGAVNRSVNPSSAAGGFGMDHYPLTGAVGGQHVETAKYLLEHEANPDTPFRLEEYKHLDRGAPLELAVRNQNTALVKLLLDWGANPDTSRYACGNAMQKAIASGNKYIINLLLRKGGHIGFDGQFDLDWTNGQNILLQAAYLQMKPAPAKGLPLRFIRSAAFNGLPDLLELALSHLSSIPTDIHFKLFQSLIEMWSLYTGNVKDAKEAGDYFECMRLLLDFGLDPNTTNHQGETCLHRLGNNAPYPSEEHRAEFVKMLLSKGADPTRLDDIIPSTPIEIAERHGFHKIAALFAQSKFRKTES